MASFSTRCLNRNLTVLTTHFPSFPRYTPMTRPVTSTLKHINNPSPSSTATNLVRATIFCHLDDCSSLSNCSPNLHAGHAPSILRAIANVTFRSWEVLEILQQLPLSPAIHALCRHVWAGPCSSSQPQLGLPSPHSLHCTIMAIFQFPKAIPLSYLVTIPVTKTYLFSKPLSSHSPES